MAARVKKMVWMCIGSVWLFSELECVCSLMEILGEIFALYTKGSS
jgi:hypothetical protein